MLPKIAHLGPTKAQWGLKKANQNPKMAQEIHKNQIGTS